MVLMKIFVSSSEKRKECELILVSIGTKIGGRVNVNAPVVPLICEPICGQPFSYAEKAFEQLSGLALVESSNLGSTMEVNILIASDYFWRFTTGRVLRQEDWAHGHLYQACLCDVWLTARNGAG